MQLFQRGAPLVVLAALAGCGPPPEGDPRFWRPVARADATVNGGDPDPDPDPGVGGTMGGTGGTGGTGGRGGSPGSVSPVDASPGRADVGAIADGGGSPNDAAPAGPSATCALSVTLTTVTTGRDYAPENIGAVWIADASGRFLKSLAVWANRRIQHLPRWNMATTAAGLPRNRVDAVTAATARNHAARTVTWNCTDTSRQQVADGPYQICFEMTEANSSDNNPPPRFQCVMFSKGAVPLEATPPDAPGFRARQLRFVP